MNTHYPYIVSTVERIIYDIAKNYYQLEKDDISVSVCAALKLGTCNAKNHLGYPISFTYKNDVFNVTDNSIMYTRSFNIPSEYAEMGLNPTLMHFRKLRPELFTVHEKTLPKHRRFQPRSVGELITDIEVYFDLDRKTTTHALLTLLDKHSVFVQDPILLKNYGVTLEIDTMSYPSISVTRTGIRPRRKFSHYVLDRQLINTVIGMA